MFKILVIEDHVLVREGLLQTLRQLVPDASPLGASDSVTALASLELNPDVELIVLDLMLPGMNGMSLLGVLRKRFASIPVVVLSAIEDTETVSKAIRQGASGFVGKSSSSAVLFDALQKVLAGEIYVPKAFAAVDDRPGRDSKVHLTPTQTKVLNLLTEGYTNQQIADLLGVTVGTIKLHFVSIYKTLNVNSRAQALIAVKKRKIRF